jgi:arylsulfatase
MMPLTSFSVESMRGIVLVLALVCVSGCAEQPTDPASIDPAHDTEPLRPNILLIVADDLGYTDLGAFGSEIPTPNLDSLANSGVRFTNFHTHAACQQTRAMLMSGLAASRAIKRNPPRADGERANELRKDIATLPELLNDAGYATYMAGKWDLGLTDDTAPHARGFDRSFSLLEASASHFAEEFWSPTSYYQENTRRLGLNDLGDEFYSTRAYTDALLEFLADHKGAKPWFGFLAFTAPHWPLQVPDDWLDRHEGRYDDGYDVLRSKRISKAMELGVVPSGARPEVFAPTAKPWTTLNPETQRRYARAQEIYASMVEYLDQEIGRVVKLLDEQGQLQNTVIFFMSDHGASAAEFGMVEGPSGYPARFDVLLENRDNRIGNMGRRNSFIDHGRGFAEAATAPLKLFKGSLSEGGIRAPAFIYYEGLRRHARIENTFFTAMDILPTFLDLAQTTHPGETVYEGRKVQGSIGQSIWPLLLGKASKVHDEKIAFGWSFRGRGALIRGEYKVTNQPDDGTWSHASGDMPWHLFNLTSDPGETKDLASEYPELARELYEEWARDWK